jgi:hypothetical protein
MKMKVQIAIAAGLAAMLLLAACKGPGGGDGDVVLGEVEQTNGSIYLFETAGAASLQAGTVTPTLEELVDVALNDRFYDIAVFTAFVAGVETGSTQITDQMLAHSYTLPEAEDAGAPYFSASGAKTLTTQTLTLRLDDFLSLDFDTPETGEVTLEVEIPLAAAQAQIDALRAAGTAAIEHRRTITVNIRLHGTYKGETFDLRFTQQLRGVRNDEGSLTPGQGRASARR